MFSGEVGSTIGQQPFRDGQVVREHQPAHWGWTPREGVLEVRARMDLGPRSMASVWMVGLEDEPARCGEICVFEVFGEALGTDGGRPTAGVGMGVHPFRDPALTDEFAAEPLAIDVADFHVYAADWRTGRIDFLVDGEHVKTVGQAPDYPMQMMIAVFDFPAKAASAADADHVPLLAVDHVGGRPGLVEDPTRAARSARAAQRGAQGGEVGRAEDHAIARGHVDEVEVDPGPRDPAGQVGEDAGAVLDVDHHDLALARDREMGDGQRVPGRLGVLDEDVQLGALARPEARGGGDVHAGVADGGGDLGQRSRGVVDVDDEVDGHVAAPAYLARREASGPWGKAREWRGAPWGARPSTVWRPSVAGRAVPPEVVQTMPG